MSWPDDETDDLDENDDPDDADMEDSDEPDLIACPYCGKSISDLADRCHHCGYYISTEDARQRPRWWIFFGVAIAVAALLAWIVG